jgi:hypothetical protein
MKPQFDIQRNGCSRLSTGARVEVDLRASFERGRRVVERRGTGAEHGDALAGERGEVDGRARMRAQPWRQRLDHRRHPPATRAFDAGRQHQLAREHRAAAAQVQVEQTVGHRFDALERSVVLDRQRQHVAVPQQVVGPVAGRDLHQRRVVRGAPLRLMPCLVGEARQAEIGPGRRLR